MTHPIGDPSALGLGWRWSSLAELSPAEVHAVLRLRQDVFILEQRCFYPDADDLDLDALHGLGVAPGGELVAYARILPPTGARREPSIGRVLVAAAWRSKGVGRSLMQAALARTQLEYPGRGVRISAQAHLEPFYSSLGFVRVSAVYDDAGIPHCDMVYEPEA